MRGTARAVRPTPAPAPSRSNGLTFAVDHRLPYQTCLAVTGEIDVATADSLVDAAINALRPSTRLLIVDLAGVSFCGAAGITALINIHHAAAAAGISLALANPGRNVHLLLDIVNINAIFAPLHDRQQPGQN
jgi:anti-anti-sigma factor